MPNFVETLLKTKYENIEKAGVELAQDIYDTWDITDLELIRVISLLEIKVCQISLLELQE